MTMWGSKICILLIFAVATLSGTIFSFNPAFAQTIAEVSFASGSFEPGCEITNECFIPFSVRIVPGGTVYWSNFDSQPHTVSSGNPDDGHDGIFESDLISSGSTYSRTFNDVGTFPYYCTLHSWMVGEILVVSSQQDVVQPSKSKDDSSEQNKSIPNEQEVSKESELNQPRIPDWIKNNAGWWADGQTTETDFVLGIQFLINNEIIQIPKTEVQNEPSSAIVPNWVKKSAGWWANDQVSDDEFINAIQFLIKNKIIQV